MKLGLDQAQNFLTSAAPIKRETVEYFLKLNIPINKIFGMSECAGPQTSTDPNNFPSFNDDWKSTVGITIEGTSVCCDKMDEKGEGELCFKGRNRFMGYYKNEQATR